LREKSGAIAIELSGLEAGWLFVMYDLKRYSVIIVILVNFYISKVNFEHAKILDTIFESIPTIEYYRRIFYNQQQ